MTRKSFQNLKRLTIALSIALLFVSGAAKAAETPRQQLDNAITRSLYLCAADKTKYDVYCTAAKDYAKARDDVIAQGGSTSDQDKKIQTYLDKRKSPTAEEINAAYLTAVSNQEIKADGTKVTVGQDFNGDCNNGGVKLGAGINSQDECVGGNGQNPIYAYLQGIIKLLGGVIGLALVITLIVSGIQYSSSAGNAQNITKAKERITNAIIGIVLYIMLAAILTYLIPNIFS